MRYSKGAVQRVYVVVEMRRVGLIDSAKSPSTKIDGSLVNFRHRLSNRHGRPRRMLTMDIRTIFVDGDLAESIKRCASDRLGDLVP